MTGQGAPPFVPGLTLSKRFYTDVVRPLLAERFPGLAYSAALLGAGSEVFGYDTPMSTDHDWGPRVLLFLPEDDVPLEEEVGAFLRGPCRILTPGSRCRRLGSPTRTATSRCGRIWGPCAGTCGRRWAMIRTIPSMPPTG